MSPKLDPGKLLFIDESSINTAMTRLYGRSYIGERVYDYTPDPRWHSTNILSALRLDGTTESMVYSGSLTGPFFKKWIESCLCPTLREGDIVVMDNLSCHKVDGVEAAIKAANSRLLYLPAYSPDLNPIEKMWSKIKAIIRGLGLNNLPDYEGMLLEAVRRALDQVTANDVAAWFQCCGYSLIL